ncbi:MAG: hypothetical protein Q7T16_02550 [Candidatus Burarchaeum sp.]|nr:hypothetical protein [Candidatus Burarchaeum sp.]MDO8339514.1 hypothetical protein [Candidatus Burarchaeum sp.]
MLDIRNTVLTYAEARRTAKGAISGINVNISLDDVLVRGQEIEINFKYTVEYAEKVGTLTMYGLMTASGSLEECQALSRQWSATRKLPKEFAEDVLNTINYACGTNGTLVVRAVNLSPPMVPPRITVADAGASSTDEGAAEKKESTPATEPANAQPGEE